MLVMLGCVSEVVVVLVSALSLGPNVATIRTGKGIGVREDAALYKVVDAASSLELVAVAGWYKAASDRWLRPGCVPLSAVPVSAGPTRWRQSVSPAPVLRELRSRMPGATEEAVLLPAE